MSYGGAVRLANLPPQTKKVRDTLYMLELTHLYMLCFMGVLLNRFFCDPKETRQVRNDVFLRVLAFRQIRNTQGTSKLRDT